LKAIDVSDVKKISEGALNKEDKTESGASDKFNELLQKLLDCCGE